MARDRAARPEAKPLRLFVAVDVPDDVRESVADAIAPLRERFPRARWSPPANWHLTVKFLGRAWPRTLDWIVGSVEGVASTAPPFATTVAGLGAFPSARRARVLWAGLEDPAGRLGAIAASLDDAMAAEYKPEKRAFTPHLTVARFDPPVEVGQDLPGASTRPFEVDRLVLYRSHLRRPAPVYEPMALFPLGGGDPVFPSAP